MSTAPFHGDVVLEEADPDVYRLIEQEKRRQWSGLELIASENFTYRAVLEANGSCLTNKYSEGRPGKRYYGGNEHVDVLENLAQQRALTAFRLKEEDWCVNVQPYSGSPANLEALHALLEPGDRLMGLALPDGGHLTHGHQTKGKAVSATALFFESHPYHVNADGFVDYETLEQRAMEVKPKLIICGGSAYPREWNYEKLRDIANACGAWLMCDMAHIAGLVAAEEQESPFPWCDVVTTTSHKTLRGPRGALIFGRKKKWHSEEPTDLERRIHHAVFPGLQGGPHNQTIAALCVALRFAASDEFRTYQRRVRENAQTLARTLMECGHKLVTDGTDNHLLLWDLRPHQVTGSKLERLLEYAAITVNKNSIPGDDKTPTAPHAVRLGTPALTARGMGVEEFKLIAKMLDRGLDIAKQVQQRSGRLLKDFSCECEKDPQVAALRKEVETLAKAFPMPGVDTQDW